MISPVCLAVLLVIIFSRSQWHALPVKDPVPPGRHFHSAVLFNDQMYIFGGTSNGYYSDLWRFNLGLSLLRNLYTLFFVWRSELTGILCI
jgi:hypothetical protein